MEMRDVSYAACCPHSDSGLVKTPSSSGMLLVTMAGGRGVLENLSVQCCGPEVTYITSVFNALTRISLIILLMERWQTSIILPCG